MHFRRMSLIFFCWGTWVAWPYARAEKKKNSRLLVGTHVMVQTLPVLVISFKTAYKKKKLYSCYITIQRVRGWAERVNTNIWDQSKNNFSEINLIFFFLTDELRFSFIDVTFVANRIIRQNVTWIRCQMFWRGGLFLRLFLAFEVGFLSAMIRNTAQSMQRSAAPRDPSVPVLISGLIVLAL